MATVARPHTRDRTRMAGVLFHAIYARRTTLALTVVLLSASALRFCALGEGIPYSLGSDEPAVMDHVVQMMKTGDLHPPFFDYPGLAFYLHLPVACLRFLKGAAAGEWDSLAAAGASDFYLWSRGVTACLGVATVLLTYRIGLRWGVRHAFLAASLIAVMPSHVRESRFVLTDVPMTFFVTLTFLLSLRAYELAGLLRFVSAGVVAGLATSTKYTAGVAVLIPLLAASMSVPERSSRLALAGGALGGFAGAFLATAPYTILDLPGFLNGFAGLARFYSPRGLDDDSGWRIYLKHLRLSLHWPAFILSFVGLAVAVEQIRKKATRLRATVLVTIPIVFLYVIADRTLIFGRYLLPIVPFICLMSATAIVCISTAIKRLLPRPAPVVLEVTLVFVAVAPMLLRSISYVRDAAVVSTQALAYEWIRTNIPEGSRIVLERNTLRFPADLYPTVFVTRLTDRSLEHYRSVGASYLVASSHPSDNTLDTDRQRDAADMHLGAGGQEIARFSPSNNQRGPDLRIIKLR